MNYDLILVRYGEIALKARHTRMRFENKLINNIKNALKQSNISFEIKKEWGRIYIYSSEIDASIEVLKKVFGIYSVSPVSIAESKLENISKKAVNVSKDRLDKYTSFAIRSSRTGSHDFSSKDVAIKVGNDIVKATAAPVDLTNPDFELFIETRQNYSYIFTEKINCIGGMPTGTQGKVIVLVENLKSLAAAFFMMRRGCKIIFLTKELNLIEKIEFFSRKWYHNSKIIEIEKSQNLFDQIKFFSKKYSADAVITGHQIYQDLDEVIKFKHKINIPVLHPLIAMSKEDVNNKINELRLDK